MAEPQPSTSVWAFLRAFGWRWLLFMSGPPTVPYTLAQVFVEQKWLKPLSGVLAVTCAALACYWVWRQERQRGHSAHWARGRVGRTDTPAGVRPAGLLPPEPFTWHCRCSEPQPRQRGR